MSNLKKQKKSALMHDTLGIIIITVVVLLFIIGILILSNNKFKDIILGYL